MSDRDAFRNRTEALNRPRIDLDPKDEPVSGWGEIGAFIAQLVSATSGDREERVCTIGIDGYEGTDWPTLVEQLAGSFDAAGIPVTFLDARSCLKTEEEIDEILRPYLGDDPVFGRLYKRGMRSLFDLEKLRAFKAQLKQLKRDKTGSRRRAVVCYGTGALLPPLRTLYDTTIYSDLTREVVLRRNRNWSRLAGKTQSISPKKLYYVDFQVHDRHRNRLLNRLDFYIDGNDEPILLTAAALQRIAAALAAWPFKLKYMYEPGPWGGQWLKRVRHLPADWVNCAWSYEIIAQEMSLLVNVGGTVVELPWTTFFHLGYDQVVGDLPKRRFAGEFPIRFDYLDTMEGGDLSIQVHPTTAYVRDNFGEPYHQGEMYYIVDAKEGAAVNLGLAQDADREAFYQAAKQADEEGIPFDYRDFVHQVPSKKHDLLLIPPGTVHGSGEGLVVLEISATTYRYTFKIYDHLRPDLNGVMRPIHLQHAFNVIKWFRRGQWVDRNLKQEPRLIRSGEGWCEVLIGDRPEFFHLVFRLEFEGQVEDDTAGKFHALTLVEGEAAEIQSLLNPERRLPFRYSETVVVPARFGKYRILNQGQGACKVVKARLR
jgi:mannose-6-phosphate isomerase